MENDHDGESFSSHEKGSETIEVELCELQIQQPAATVVGESTREASSSRIPGLKGSSAGGRKPSRSTLSVFAAVLALFGSVAYLTAKPGRTQVAGAAADTREVSLPPASLPVHFANPFDPSEVFDFPAGTTEAAARDAVAAILLERARDRQESRNSNRSERVPAAGNTRVASAVDRS